MSTVLRPVGPEPPDVYWRRRAAVVAAVLLVLFGLWWLLLRGSGGGTPSVGPSTSPSPSAPTTSSTTSPATSTPATSPAPSSSPTTLSACPDSSIAVKATTDAATYPAGSPVKLTLTITNVGTVACTRDVGAKANELAVTSGGYAVWSSDDCNPGGASNVVTMKPKDVYAVTVTWDGRLTEGKCVTDGPEAKPGSYDVVGRNGAVKSPQTRFVLT